MARGLNFQTDAPMLSAKALATGEFARGMQSSKANAALNLGQQNSIFQQGLSNFQNQLQQQAMMNRMSTTTGLASPMFSYGLGQQYGNRNISGGGFNLGGQGYGNAGGALAAYLTQGSPSSGLAQGVGMGMEGL